MLVGAAVVIIILLFVVGTFLGGGKKEARAALLVVAQSQQETSRVAEAISGDASSQAVKNIAITTDLGMTSDQKTLNTALGAYAISFKEKELVSATAAKTDKTLEDAKAAGTYDTTALQTLKASVDGYVGALQNAYAKVTNARVKDAIKTNFETAKLLKQQLDTTNL